MKPILVGLVFVAVALAADPFVGTWKLNLSKSKHLPGDESAPSPKVEMAAFQEAGRDLILTDKIVSNDGETSVVISRFPAKGGFVTNIDTTARAGRTATVRRIDAHSMVVTMRTRNRTLTLRDTLSPDERSVTVAVKGVGLSPQTQGKRIDRIEVLDRQ